MQNPFPDYFLPLQKIRFFTTEKYLLLLTFLFEVAGFLLTLSFCPVQKPFSPFCPNSISSYSFDSTGAGTCSYDSNSPYGGKPESFAYFKAHKSCKK